MSLGCIRRQMTINEQDSEKASSPAEAASSQSAPDGTEATVSASSSEPPSTKRPTAKPKTKARPKAKPKPKAAAKAKPKGRASSAPAPTSAAKYPRHSVVKALRIPTAIYEQNGGKPATPKQAVQFAGGASLSGQWKVEISSSKKYGFLESTSSNQLALTDRARKAIAPQSPTDRLTALRDGLLAAPDLSDVYNYYRGENLPDQEFFVNALTERFNLPIDKIGEFSEIFNESIREAELLDELGERPKLIDVGRDEQHQAGKRAAPGKSVAAAGASCFVMQLFAAPLGAYYESLYRPAIEQVGLQPVRADAEIFGTGKIMDQIWRGIRSATILVAELTTGIPMCSTNWALLTRSKSRSCSSSSNQDDVPFDLRHIRVILYDQMDPFWGQADCRAPTIFGRLSATRKKRSSTSVRCSRGPVFSANRMQLRAAQRRFRRRSAPIEPVLADYCFARQPAALGCAQSVVVSKGSKRA